MIAKLPTLPPSPASRADQAVSSAKNQSKTAGRAEQWQEQWQRQRAGNPSKTAERIDAPAAGDDAGIDRSAEGPRDPVTNPKATQRAGDAEPSASNEGEPASALQPSEVDAGEQQESVEAVALDLVWQVTQSMAVALETATQPVAATGQQAVSAVQAPLKKSEHPSQAVIDAGASMDVEADSNGEADGPAALTQAGTPAAPADESSAGSQAGAMSSGEALLEPGVASTSLIKPANSHGETAPLTAPAPAPAPVSEALSAQLAQLPQGDEEAVRDQINMGRLTRGLHSALNQRGGSVTLRLTPPELGMVRIDMAVREGVVNAKFTAQSESVRNLLMDQMGQLRQALDRQGLSVDRIEVQITQQAGESGLGQQRDDMGRDGRSAGQHHSPREGRGNPSDPGASRRTDADTFDRALADVIK